MSTSTEAVKQIPNATAGGTTLDPKRHAEMHGQRAQRDLAAQFQRLKDESRTLFGAVNGRRGVRTAEDWQRMLEEAGDSLGNGRFLVQQLGADRYLDPAMVARLVTLRQNLLAEIVNPRTADVMIVDSAILGYYNMIRTQHWIGDISLVIERELFGQAPLNEVLGPEAGERLREELRRLGEQLVPLQDRAQKMMLRALDRCRR